MLTRGPFWPLRRVDASFLHLEYSLFVVYTLHRLECNRKRRVAVGPLTLFQVHPTYRISAFQGKFKPHNTPINILQFLNVFLNTSLIQVKSFCYLRVTYLLPTNYFLLLLKATKKPFNRAFCFKHSTFKLTFRELWSTTSCFKTVFFTFFSTRVTSNESCSF